MHGVKNCGRLFAVQKIFLNKKARYKDSYHKADFINRKYNKRSTCNFACTPFHTSCPARYSVLRFYFLSGNR